MTVHSSNVTSMAPHTSTDPHDVPPKTDTSPRRRLPGWRFWVPLALQSALILAVPAQDAVTYATGSTVTLQTAPVDPYDFMRGYYQTLSYEISLPTTLQALPGGETLFTDTHSWQPQTFYVVLDAPPVQSRSAIDPGPGSLNTPPAPWQPTRVSTERPTDLSNHQIALKGEYTGGGGVTYGLERYYMPADQRRAINNDINQTQWHAQTAFVVDIKVDRSGHAVPVGLWVQERNYRF